MFKPGRPVHPSNGNGTAPNAATTPEGVEVSFDAGPNRGRGTTVQVIISNREAAAGNPLEVSFADGRKGRWFSIMPQMTLLFNVSVHRCRLRGLTGGTTDYSIMGIVA